MCSLKPRPRRRPIRDEASTTYVGAIEIAELFGRRLYTEARERGWSRAKKKVVLGDGADWIWNIADQHFPGAIQIVDLWHAQEHIWEVAAKPFPSDDSQRRSWARKLVRRLKRGQVEIVIEQLRAFPTRQLELRHILRTEADYFERNRERMRYPKSRKQGLLVGSEVIEAGCKTVIGSRLQQSGMFWTVRGANAIIALRTTQSQVRRLLGLSFGSRMITHLYVAHPGWSGACDDHCSGLFPRSRFAYSSLGNASLK